MAIKLGKDAASPPFGTGIISASYTEDQEVIDVTNRANVNDPTTGGIGKPGYRASMTGFKTRTWELECHDPAGLITSLQTQATANVFSVMSVTENISVDGAVTFTVTLKEG